MAEAVQQNVSAGFLSALQRSGREIEAVVNGRSMGSCIPAGSRIKFRPLESGAHPIKHGDIVVHLATTGLLIAHRVVVLGSNWCKIPFVITQGDSQTLCDMPADVSALQGMVTAVCRDDTWEVPSQQPPPRPFSANMIARLTLWIVTLWAWLSGASQRTWISRNLLRLRTL